MFGQLSFWNLSETPILEAVIQAVDLRPIGSLDEVTEALLDIPTISLPIRTVADVLNKPEIKLVVNTNPPFIMSYEPERDSEVFVIRTNTVLVSKGFYRTFVQLHELFGVVVLDEIHQVFMTPKQFKNFYH